MDLQNTYATLLQAHADFYFEKGAALHEELAPLLPSYANDAQTTAHGTLTQLLQGRWLAVWDATRATPGYVHLEHPIVAVDGSQAKSAFDASLGTLVTDLYQVEAPHEMALVDSRTIALDDSEELVAHRFRYEHLYDGVVVDGDRLDLTLRPLDDQTSAWIPVIGARWTRDIALQTTKPVLPPEQAAEVALASGETDQGQLLGEPKLVIVTHGASKLVYRVRIGDGIGQWSYHVDAVSGEVTSVSNQTLHNSGSSGSLNIMVSRPHEGNAKHARPLPHVRIWKDEIETQSPQGCGANTATQWIGSEHLGTTTYGGQYWGVGPGVSDDWWTVDYRGVWMWDRSLATHSLSLTMPFFLKGTEHTFPVQEIHNRSRRGEIYYLTTHAARTYSAYGIAQYQPLVFNYTGQPYGDTPQSAAALVADLEPRTAEIDFPGDHDVFRLASSEPQTLEYWICPPNGGFTPRVQVLDENETVIATMTNNNCGASNSTVSIGAGIYYLRARAAHGSATGTYQIRALLTSDIDVDSTPANAWELALALATPAEGEVIGARFESAQDEDWFSFTTAYDSFNFVVETYAPPGGSADTMLEVYAPPETIFGRTGTLDSLPDTSGHGIGHWMLQDHGGALSPGGSRLAFLVPAPGTYYIRVRNMGGNDAPYYLAFHRSSVVSSLFPYP